MENCRRLEYTATARVIEIRVQGAENGEPEASLHLRFKPREVVGAVPSMDSLSDLIIRTGPIATREFELGDEFEVTIRGPVKAKAPAEPPQAADERAGNRRAGEPLLPAPGGLIEALWPDGTWREGLVEEIDRSRREVRVMHGGIVRWLPLDDEGKSWRRRGRKG